MPPKKILSLQHPKVKHWVALRKERGYREEMGRMLISGKKVVEELSGPIEEVIAVEPAEGVTSLVTHEIMKKITGLQEPDGWAAEISLPPPSVFDKEKFILILDRVQDPGNLGTLLRTALALGWEGVILTGDTVDLFNDKAMRSARGATFRLPYTRKTHAELATWVKGRQVWVADLEGEAASKVTLRPPLVLVLSNEGQGVSEWAQKIGQKVSIAMKGEMESLSVASAGAILMYALKGESS